jgi:hypothetical protein
MSACALSSADKKVVARNVGRDLVKHHGKKRYYTIPEVKDAARRQSIPIDWDCWALALYTHHLDFADYHRRIGESCDFEEMHKVMMGVAASDMQLVGDGLGLSQATNIEVEGDSSFFDFLDWIDFDADE